MSEFFTGRKKIMQPKPQYRVTKNGSWQPYIPTLGMTSGCRPGIRNKAEEFHIKHLAKNYQDDRLVKASEGKEVPTAASCSFQGSSPVPIVDDAIEMGMQSHGAASRTGKSSGSFLSGFVPRDIERSERVRLHQGKVTQDTGARDCLNPRINSMTSKNLDPRSVNNPRSIIPPDNLTVGLHPHESFSMKPRATKIVPNENRIQHLGAGLVPLDPLGSVATEENDHPIVPRISQGPNGEYIRVYGDGFKKYYEMFQAEINAHSQEV